MISARPFQIAFSAGDRFPRRAAWLEDFTAELLAFPGRHDAFSRHRRRRNSVGGAAKSCVLQRPRVPAPNG
jgi:hypothetical protein